MAGCTGLKFAAEEAAEVMAEGLRQMQMGGERGFDGGMDWL